MEKTKEIPIDEFDIRIDRSGTASVKWDRYGGRDVIPLWVADMDFRAPDEVVRALQDRVAHGIFGYTSTPPELAEIVCARLKDDYDWRVEPGWLVWFPGVMAGVYGACRAVGVPGDECITFVPVYPPFLSAPALSQRSLVTVALENCGNRWGIDWDALADTVTPRSRVLLLCNPHNPVGRVWTDEELERLSSFALRHDLVVISDEIHAGLVLSPGTHHRPIAALHPDIARRTITILSPSKTFNIPGLDCAFAVISDAALRRSFRKAMRGVVPGVNILGYTAAMAAYRLGEPWRQRLVAYLRGNRDLVAHEIGKMAGLSVNDVEATYLAWIDTRSSGIPDPCRFFEDAGVGLSDGAEFGAPGFVRLNFGCPRPLLAEALLRMHKTLATGNP